MNIRPAAVSGTWYPAKAGALAREVDGYVDAAGPGPRGSIAAIVVPHAGLMFSGPVAAHAFKAASTRQYDVAILVGPSHFAAFDGIAAYPGGAFDCPLGVIPIDDGAVGAIVEANSKLRPVHANGMVGQGSINVNRRFRATAELEAAVGLNPNEYVDRDLVVIRLDDAEGNPYAVMVNFQCHGTVLAYENKYVSPDWIGSMRQTVDSYSAG